MPKQRTEDTDGSDNAPRKRKQVGTGYDAPFRGYINLNLSTGQKDAYDKWFDSGSFAEQLSFQVGDGVNLSLKIDPKGGGGFLASATQRREDSPNAGLVVTARASDPVKALGRVVYCLTILSHKPAWEDTQPLADPDRW
jgi:hypothetical protein